MVKSKKYIKVPQTLEQNKEIGVFFCLLVDWRACNFKIFVVKSKIYVCATVEITFKLKVVEIWFLVTLTLAGDLMRKNIFY